MRHWVTDQCVCTDGATVMKLDHQHREDWKAQARTQLEQQVSRRLGKWLVDVWWYHTLTVLLDRESGITGSPIATKPLANFPTEQNHAKSTR